MFRDQPKNLVHFDGEKRSSIRTFQNHPSKQQSFQIGWEVSQKSEQLTSKIGQQANSFVPKYQASSVPPAPYKENILASNGNQVASYGNYNDYATGMAKAQLPPQPSYPSYQDEDGPVPNGNPYYDDADDGYGYAPSYQAPASEIRQGINEALNIFLDVAGDSRRVNAARNQTSNIFNTDLAVNDRESTGGSKRGPLKKKNEDVQTKGYGSFYQQNGTGQYVGVPRATQKPRQQQSSSVFGY